MKLSSFFFALAISLTLNGQNLKPYILGATSKSSISDVKKHVGQSLKTSGFIVVGQYQPANDANRYIIVVSHPKLNEAVKNVGGLSGFASTLRVAITKEGSDVNVSYTNPIYWGNAYFQDDYSKVEANYKTLTLAFKTAMEGIGTLKSIPFGSEKGEEADDLREYHYMFGMPYFNDVVELGEFSNTAQAVAHIDKALESGKPGVGLVYKYPVSGTDIVLYGIALNGVEGEKKFMPIIDISNPKHTAFLPYEMLVIEGKVIMLHGRYRIALSFPDLTMGTFTKIMSTPGDIEDSLSQLVE